MSEKPISPLRRRMVLEHAGQPSSRSLKAG
jgi:hypothetical protein